MQGREGEAAELYRKVIAFREKQLGPSHLDTVHTMTNLAITLNDMDNHQEAIELHHRALEVREETLGPEHPETLQSVSHLAVALHVRGDLSEALALQRRALEARERDLGPQHPSTCRSLRRILSILVNMINKEEAPDDIVELCCELVTSRVTTFVLSTSMRCHVLATWLSELATWKIIELKLLSCTVRLLPPKKGGWVLAMLILCTQWLTWPSPWMTWTIIRKQSNCTTGLWRSEKRHWVPSILRLCSLLATWQSHCMSEVIWVKPWHCKGVLTRSQGKRSGSSTSKYLQVPQANSVNTGQHDQQGGGPRWHCRAVLRTGDIQGDHFWSWAQACDVMYWRPGSQNWQHGKS